MSDIKAIEQILKSMDEKGHLMTIFLKPSPINLPDLRVVELKSDYVITVSQQGFHQSIPFGSILLVIDQESRGTIEVSKIQLR